MNEKQTCLGQFEKNSMELVVVHLQTWKTQQYVDIRIWMKGDPGHPGAEQATKKGICLNVELLPDLMRLLEEAARLIEKGEDPEETAGDAKEA
jgi:hypothetical protein